MIIKMSGGKEATSLSSGFQISVQGFRWDHSLILWCHPNLKFHESQLFPFLFLKLSNNFDCLFFSKRKDDNPGSAADRGSEEGSSWDSTLHRFSRKRNSGCRWVCGSVTIFILFYLLYKAQRFFQQGIPDTSQIPGLCQMRLFREQWQDLGEEVALF